MTIFGAIFATTSISPSLSPPTGFAFVTDNNGNYLLANGGKYIITETV